MDPPPHTHSDRTTIDIQDGSNNKPPLIFSKITMIIFLCFLVDCVRLAYNARFAKRKFRINKQPPPQKKTTTNKQNKKLVKIGLTFQMSDEISTKR